MAKKIENNFKVYFTAIVLLTLFFLFYVYENIHIIKLGYQLQQKNEELFEITLKNDALSLELGELTSLERLDRIGRGRMGLRSPNKDEVILIRYVRGNRDGMRAKYSKL